MYGRRGEEEKEREEGEREKGRERERERERVKGDIGERLVFLIFWKKKRNYALSLLC
jgi:hypothetical protein